MRKGIVLFGSGGYNIVGGIKKLEKFLSYHFIRNIGGVVGK